MKRLMHRPLLLLALMLPIAAATAQPVKNVDAKRWPNLAAAQAAISEAYGRLGDAQKANNADLGGHAEKARKLLIEANAEVKLAAVAANAKR